MRQTLCDMGNVYVFYITSICIHGEEITQQLAFHRKKKQKISQYLKNITEQSDEIYGVNTITWEDSSWKYLFLVGDEEVISLLHT